MDNVTFLLALAGGALLWWYWPTISVSAELAGVGTGTTSLNTAHGASPATGGSGNAAAPAGDDADILARTMWGEARGDGSAGMTAVACVVRNRTKDLLHYGGVYGAPSYRAVCLARWQFSCWNANDPNLPKLKAVTAADAQFAEAQKIAAAVIAGTTADTTMGATLYHTTSIPTPAKWGSVLLTVIIGGQAFYKRNDANLF